MSHERLPVVDLLNFTDFSAPNGSGDSTTLFTTSGLHNSTTLPTWHLRHILEVTDAFTLASGLLLNALLVWLVLCHSPREQSTPYKSILLVTCAMNVFVMQIQVHKSHMEFSCDGHIYAIIGRRQPGWGEPWDSGSLLGIVTSEFLYLLVVPLQSFYRYLVICRRKFSRRDSREGRLSYRHVAAFVVAALALTAIGDYLFVRALLEPTAEEYAKSAATLARDPLWAGELAPAKFFVLFDKTHFYSKVAALYILLLSLAAYILLVVTSWRLWWYLHSFRHDMSPPTREMNIQLTKVLIVQSAVPTIFTLLPPTIATFYTWLSGGVLVEHVGLLIAIPMSLSSIVDPASTILIIPGYRRVLFRCGRAKKAPSGSAHSRATTRTGASNRTLSSGSANNTIHQETFGKYRQRAGD